MAEISADVPSVPRENFPLKEAGGVLTAELLSRVEQGRPLQEEEHGRIVVPVTLALHRGTDPRLIMVFQETKLVVVCGIHSLLEVHVVQPVAQYHFTPQIAVEALSDVIFIFHVEGLIGFGIPRAAEALPADQVSEALVHRLAQPDAAGPHLLDEAARHVPEADRDEGCHVAAESVHDLRPLAQRLDLIVPESRHGVVQVDDVGPVADLVTGIAVFVAVIELGVLPQQHRVRRGVVIDHVDHALHAAPVDLLRQSFEVLHCPVGRVHAAVVAVCVRAAEASFLSLHADGVDRHEPDDIRPQRLDPVQIRNDGEEGPLFGMRPDIYGINHLLLQVDVGVSRHVKSSPAKISELYARRRLRSIANCKDSTPLFRSVPCDERQ